MFKLGSSPRANRPRGRRLLSGIILACAVAPAAFAGPPAFQQIDPTARTYLFALGGDYTQYFSAVDDVTGFVQAVELTLPPTAMPTSTSGCQASDFGGFTAGGIALMQRGGCTAGQKADNAFAAGAIGALIFNEGQPGRLDAVEFSYPGFTAPIPTFNLSFALGQSLAEALGEGPVRVRMVTDEEFFRAPPVGSVPETSTWALMIAGFGLAGARLRRRRTSGPEAVLRGDGRRGRPARSDKQAAIGDPGQPYAIRKGRGSSLGPRTLESNMQPLTRACCGLALSAVTFGASQAAVAVAPSTVLASSPGSYAGLDASGTSLDVSSTPGGSLGVFAPGDFEGLYFGGNQGSATYTLQFSAAIDYFSIRINALSTFGAFVETLSNFTIDGGAAPSFAFQNIQNTSWDGFTVTSGPQDNGEFILEIMPQGGGAFTSVSFDHLQINNPNGSIVREVRYQLADGPSGAVPEPETWALLILGFGATGAALRRCRSPRPARPAGVNWARRS